MLTAAGGCSAGIKERILVWVCRVEEIRDQDIGTKAGLFEVLKIGDEFYSFIVDCKDPKACTILLRGASKDVLNEVRPPPQCPYPCLSMKKRWTFLDCSFPYTRRPLWSAMLPK